MCPQPVTTVGDKVQPLTGMATDREDPGVADKPYQATTGEEPTRELSVDDILNFIGFGRFQVVAFLLAGFTYFAYACDVSLFIFVGSTLQQKWNLTELEYAILPAVTSIPNLIGSFIVSFLSDRYGRVWPYALTLIWTGMFSVGSAFAPTYPALIALRGLTSIGIGGIPVLTFPTLIEFLPLKNRGKVSLLVVLISVIGLCVSCGLAWWLIPSYSSYGWRYFIIATGVPVLLVALFRLLFYFESPRFLIGRGNSVKGWNVLSRMAWMNGKVLANFVQKEELDTALCLIEVKRTNSTSIRQLLTIFKRPYLRRTLCLMILIPSETFGYMGATLFLPQFLKGIGETDTYFAILVAFVAQIPGILFMSIIVEWPFVGRLNSLRLFSVLATVFFLLLAFVQTQISIPLFLVLIYFSMLPILPLLFTYISESYPTNIRALTTAYFYSIEALCGPALPFVGAYAVALNSYHWVYPAVWAGIFAVQFVAALVLNYEPYGKKLQDIPE